MKGPYLYLHPPSIVGSTADATSTPIIAIVVPIAAVLLIVTTALLLAAWRNLRMARELTILAGAASAPTAKPEDPVVNDGDGGPIYSPPWALKV